MSQPARTRPLGQEELVSEAEYLQNVVHGAMHEDPAGLRTLTEPTTIYRLYFFLKQASDAIRSRSSQRMARDRPSRTRGMSKKPRKNSAHR